MKRNLYLVHNIFDMNLPHHEFLNISFWKFYYIQIFLQNFKKLLSHVTKINLMTKCSIY